MWRRRDGRASELLALKETEERVIRFNYSEFRIRGREKGTSRKVGKVLLKDSMVGTIVNAL